MSPMTRTDTHAPTNRRPKDIALSIVVYKEGLVEVAYGEKVVLLKPKNPVVILAPFLATLGLMMGSKLVFEREVKRLIQVDNAKE